MEKFVENKECSKKLVSSVDKILDDLLKGQGLRVESQINQGRVNHCYVLSNNENKKFFVKINIEIEDILEREVSQLKILSKFLHVPDIIENSKHYIILDYIEFKPIKEENDYIRLAKELAAFHKITKNSCGFEFDTYHGKCLMPNRTNKSWLEFFKENRLSIWVDKMKDINISYWILGRKIMDNLYHIIDDKECHINMLHGDLNEGNWNITKKSEIYFFDPHLFNGHNLLDIAALTCFSNIPKIFFEIYNEILPLPKNYENYVAIYEYYILLTAYYINLNSKLIKRANQLAEDILNRLNNTEKIPLTFPSLINLDKLKSLSNSESRKNCIFIICGSFNPIHNNHIKLANQTKKYLEEVNSYQVLGGFFSPTSDHGLNKKLKGKTYNLKQRAEMIELAIKQEEWSLDLSEIHNLTNIENTVKSYYNCNIDFFIVCGSDTLSQIIGLRNNFKIICNQRLKEEIPVDKKKEGVEYISFEDTQISSTRIRELLALKTEKADSKLKKMLNEAVFDYLKHIK
jgi:cytidyltransferase-like protein